MIFAKDESENSKGVYINDIMSAGNPPKIYGSKRSAHSVERVDVRNAGLCAEVYEKRIPWLQECNECMMDVANNMYYEAFIWIIEVDDIFQCGISSNTLCRYRLTAFR
ncbi:hypothetical protein AB6A40_011682 [Gnathostoma spinigerum]|uniref:Uncharacterized protein n=1 Tax=Gnathostoma spinigerum TaxID=75299 RepID=A0ABD6F3X5_9BILA